MWTSADTRLHMHVYVNVEGLRINMTNLPRYQVSLNGNSTLVWSPEQFSISDWKSHLSAKETIYEWVNLYF